MKKEIAVIQNVRIETFLKFNKFNVVDLVFVVAFIIKYFYTYKTTYLYLIICVKN
ncbi:hypothetical protein GCM10007028_34680 [Algibacter mikhailovii]|uniref:Uncharacterized protein n=1 Tax=Algibacter mikhailovii TaxID=425498 RepID=A0A918RCY3_9FLAO|nr:hypothetical protein GCM10007028_34680 [Algibacter mikhailovii]